MNRRRTLHIQAIDGAWEGLANGVAPSHHWASDSTHPISDRDYPSKDRWCMSVCNIAAKPVCQIMSVEPPSASWSSRAEVGGTRLAALTQTHSTHPPIRKSAVSSTNLRARKYSVFSLVTCASCSSSVARTPIARP